jgi:hypothetical protein
MSLGVSTLQTRCSGQCLITLQDTSKAGDKAIRMSDGRCYYISAITDYIKRLILRGMDTGDPDFLLPTRAPITNRDLNMLFMDPNEIRAKVIAERARERAAQVPVTPRPFDPNRLYIPDGYFDGRNDARALRKPKRKTKRTKRVRKMTKRK